MQSYFLINLSQSYYHSALYCTGLTYVQGVPFIVSVIVAAVTKCPGRHEERDKVYYCPLHKRM
jgi:hypothetical protein